MANAYFAVGEQRAVRVGDLFAAIAPRYDLLNDLQSLGLHRRWKRRAADLAAVGPGTRALDVCCGTGDLAFALAARGARVTGLDFSERMLEVARRRQSGAGTMGAGIPPIEFLQGDALALPFEEDCFDAVTVGYGLRNLASWERGLGEMRRVARPGGRLVVLDFGKPDLALWRGLYYAYLRTVAPLLGWWFCRDAAAYAYILESLRHYPAQRGVEAKMRESGLEEVRTLTFLGGVMSLNFGRKPRR